MTTCGSELQLKIRCVHGFFFFEEQKSGQLYDFQKIFGFTLSAFENGLTFSALKDAPRHSIEGSTFMNATATATFEGNPWDVMRENGLVFNFASGLIVPLASVSDRVIINNAERYFLSSGLIQPGAVTDDGKRVTDYSAFFYFDSNKFRYSEVTLV